MCCWSSVDPQNHDGGRVAAVHTGQVRWTIRRWHEEKWAFADDIVVEYIVSSRFIDASRYLSRDMYRDTVCNNRDTSDLATFLRFLFECHTDINCQSAKNYQCPMSSHPQQTTGSSSQLKSIKLCGMSVISNKWSYDLSVVTGPSSLDSSRRRVSTLVIVFFACDFRGPGKTLLALRTIPFSHERPKSRTWDKLNWPLERSHFPTHDQSPESIHSCQRCYGLNMRQTDCNFLQCNMSKRGDHGTANAINKYRDTYRIVTQVSRYVSHREIRYRDNTTNTPLEHCQIWQ